MTIKLKNVSSRTCTRDIGADMQELRLVQGTTIVWSSDDCNANTGHDNTSFAPGKEMSFTLTLDGPGQPHRHRRGDLQCDRPAAATRDLPARG